MWQLNAGQLRDSQPTAKQLEEIKSRRREIYLLLDNIYDTYNVGGMFRLADAVGVKKMYLTGRTECPPNSRIEKAAVGTDRWVEWEYCADAAAQISKLKFQISKLKVVGVEQTEKSVSLDKMLTWLPMLLVVGNETEGISPEVLDLCDQVVELPMYGVNRSMNVIVSAAMVLGRLFES